MKALELNALVSKSESRRLELRVQKGEEYTRGEEDVLSNFKRVAAGLGLSPLQVWWVYFHKHIDALASFIRLSEERSNEPIEGRIDDLHVYLDLCYGLVKEEKDRREKEKKNRVPA